MQRSRRLATSSYVVGDRIELGLRKCVDAQRVGEEAIKRSVLVPWHPDRSFLKDWGVSAPAFSPVSGTVAAAA